MGAFVYRAEAKGIQSWILASDRLRELKGGSALIDALAEDATRLFARVGARGTLVSAAAGAVEIHFDDAEALARFAAAWPAVVEARAPGLTLVHAWVALANQRQLFAGLGAARNARAPQLPEAGPLVARSGRTGLPAVKASSDGMEDATVRAKLLAAEVRGLDGLLSNDDLDFCDDAEQLGDSYLAVVHADGNGVGALFQAIESAAERRALSENLTEATRAAAKRAVAALVTWSKQDERLIEPRGRDARTRVRARPVVLGGDDVTFLVDAAYALPFTYHFLVAFEEETARFGPAITACAGVAFVKTGFPFHAAHDLAESLCKAAKAGLRTEGGATRSGLLFHRVTTSSTDTDWTDILHGELGRQGGRTRWFLSGGPYDLVRLTQLEELTRTTYSLPRKALREWLTLVQIDPARADAHWKRAREVAGATSDAWKGFAAALEVLGHDPQTGWESVGPATHRSALADALAWRGLQPDDADRLRQDTPGRSA